MKNQRHTPSYEVLISAKTAVKVNEYRIGLISKQKSPGKHLSDKLKKLRNIDLEKLTNDQLLELLIQTKKPQIFAESEIVGDGKDWNDAELSILGDVSFSVPVTIFDDGVHEGNIRNHTEPFEGELLFVPGALLGSEIQGGSPDRIEVVKNNGEIDDQKLYELYERRLLPSLVHASKSSGAQGAIVTIPGIGCGAFAGEFKGTLEEKIQRMLIRLLETHAKKLPHIRAVIFDPNKNTEGCHDVIENIAGIQLVTKAGHFGKDNSQLKTPKEYGYLGCDLFSVVAWDQGSWPGNDFYEQNTRKTDDGVKAAATDLCKVLTGVEGHYNETTHKFMPLEGFLDWNQVICRNKLQLYSQNNTWVMQSDGNFILFDFDRNRFKNSELKTNGRPEDDFTFMSPKFRSVQTNEINSVVSRIDELEEELGFWRFLPERAVKVFVPRKLTTWTQLQTCEAELQKLQPSPSFFEQICCFWQQDGDEDGLVIVDDGKHNKMLGTQEEEKLHEDRKKEKRSDDSKDSKLLKNSDKKNPQPHEKPQENSRKNSKPKGSGDGNHDSHDAKKRTEEKQTPSGNVRTHRSFTSKLTEFFVRKR